MPALSAAQSDRFRAIDRNGDGFISSEEWYRQGAAAPVPFTVIDLNGDGRISESEFREWSSARGGAGVMGVTTADRFRAIDKNKDGVISAEEWKNGWVSQTPFASVDANKDGKISRSEFNTWEPKARRSRGSRTCAAAGSRRTHDERAAAQPRSRRWQRFRTCRHGWASCRATVAAPNPIQPDTCAAIGGHNRARHESNPRRKLAEHE